MVSSIVCSYAKSNRYRVIPHSFLRGLLTPIVEPTSRLARKNLDLIQSPIVSRKKFPFAKIPEKGLSPSMLSLNRMGKFMSKLLWLLVVAFPIALWADGPADNLADKVRRVPPPGISIPASDRAELESGEAALGQEIDALRAALKSKPALLELLPDVQIYHNAVRYALAHDEFYRSNEVSVARGLLKQGLERAQALRDGKSPWTAQTGLVARGYLSRIDGSVQPYGMVVPPSFQPGGAPLRLDFWIHGRGENLSELSFIDGRQKSPGEFVPHNAFVLHLYGRYCCANKFAGEIDLFEALESARKNYPLDENRLVVRGFSMGGAGCWQFAAHYPSRFCAAAPGA